MRESDWNDPIDSREEGTQKYASKSANAAATAAAAALAVKPKVIITSAEVTAVISSPIQVQVPSNNVVKKGSNAKVLFSPIYSLFLMILSSLFICAICSYLELLFFSTIFWHFATSSLCFALVCFGLVWFGLVLLYIFYFITQNYVKLFVTLSDFVFTNLHIISI